MSSPALPARIYRPGWNPGVVLVGLAATAAVCLLWACNPATSRIFPPCPFLGLTGFYCPGCGSLRALHQLLHGNLRMAVALNPLAVLLLPFLGYGALSRASMLVRRQPLPHFFLPAVWIRILLGGLLLFGVLRNIPAYPFRWLAPEGLLRVM
jgi:hypothetical protein